VSLPPGILFVIGSFMVSESPRWLFRRGKRDAAETALLRSRTDEQAAIELAEMEQAVAAERTTSSNSAKGTGEKLQGSLLRRKYVIPFLLACVILACNQATGVNSIIGYNTNILLQSGLSDVQAHWGYVVFTIVNFLVTIGGVMLVDRKGRKFLLSLGTAGIILSLVFTGLLFRQTERLRVDSRSPVQSMVKSDQTITLTYDKRQAETLLSSAANGVEQIGNRPTSLVVIYSYGDFHAATKAARSDDTAATPIEITRESCVPANKVVAFFSNPFGDLDAARQAQLRIDDALITPLPSQRGGWKVALTLFVFMAFYAVGPGVCVWLPLSELMPP